MLSKDESYEFRDKVEFYEENIKNYYTDKYSELKRENIVFKYNKSERSVNDSHIVFISDNKILPLNQYNHANNIDINEFFYILGKRGKVIIAYKSENEEITLPTNLIPALGFIDTPLNTIKQTQPNSAKIVTYKLTLKDHFQPSIEVAPQQGKALS